MLQTDNVAESLQCYSGKPEIPELPVALQIGGIENDMVMNMCSVHMSRYNKCVLEKLKEQSKQVQPTVPVSDRKPVPGCCFEREFQGW